MTPLRRSSSTLLLALACLGFTACTPTGDGEGPVARIAFFQDLSVPDHVDLVSPSFLAFDLALQRRLAGTGVEAEVVQLDTAGDPATALDMAREVMADPSYVLAVLAPFWHEPGDVARVLAEAGVPTISLSPVSASPWLGSPPPPGEALELWRRFVPDRTAESALLADIAARRSADGVAQPVCLVRDGSPYGRGLIGQVAADLGDWPVTSIDAADPEAAAGAVREIGCPVVVWGGFAPGARSFARALRDADAARGRPVDLAGDAMKTIVPPTSPAGDGVVVGSVACSCVDVSIGLGLSSRRFVNVFQSEHGLAPGVYAAEAWDAGRLTASTLEASGAGRASMRAWMRTFTGYEGVARSYAFDDLGELVDGRPGLFVAAGTRWLPLPA
jgi:ABC-type branched-subunit amino acid transport system substrate-binding protein